MWRGPPQHQLPLSCHQIIWAALPSNYLILVQMPAALRWSIDHQRPQGIPLLVLFSKIWSLLLELHSLVQTNCSRNFVFIPIKEEWILWFLVLLVVFFSWLWSFGSVIEVYDPEHAISSTSPCCDWSVSLHRTSERSCSWPLCYISNSKPSC